MESVLYSFLGGADDANPTAGLIADARGALYGTTYFNGFCFRDYRGCGTVFKLTPPTAGKIIWTETVLHTFNGVDGYGPHVGLLADAHGALYGTTLFTSTTKCHACGNVFKLTPPTAGKGNWTESVLHAFTGGVDGDGPYGGLIADRKGVLYGTTILGGATACLSGCGTVFSLSPRGKTGWTESILHAFSGADGTGPNAGLLGEGGAVYGTTSAGGSTACGAPGCGSVFQLKL